jgi:release factor glutamine methyltransferase
MEQQEFRRLIQEAETKLEDAGIPSPAAEVEIVIETLLNIERINLYLHGADLIDANMIKRFEEIIEKRTSRYPLQYILGEMYFYGRRFIVTPDVMVPTPETEVLCDLAVNYINNEGIETPSILDVGVGSGVISVTIACEIPKAEIMAVDISEKTLEIASNNAGLHGVRDRIKFVQSDLFSQIGNDALFDLILSNPPYISEEEYKTLPPEVLADPKISLVSGEQGLDIIKKLIECAPKYLKSKGRLMFEIGYNQADKVVEISEKDLRYRSISIMKDLNDIDRVVILSI